MSGGAAYFPICGLKCPFAGDYSCHGSKCAHVFGCLIKYIYIHRYIGFYRYAYIETEVYRIHIIEYIIYIHNNHNAHIYIYIYILNEYIYIWYICIYIYDTYIYMIHTYIYIYMFLSMFPPPMWSLRLRRSRQFPSPGCASICPCIPPRVLRCWGISSSCCVTGQNVWTPLQLMAHLKPVIAGEHDPIQVIYRLSCRSYDPAYNC